MTSKAMLDASAVFGGVEKAKGKRSNNYVRAGGYICKINAVRLDKSRKEELFVAVEMTVLHVLFTATDDDGKIESHNAGEDIAHLIMKKFDMFLPNIKSMVAALAGCDEDEVTEEVCVEMVGDDQPFAHCVIELHARDTVTRSNKDFTDVTYVGLVSRAQCAEYGITPPEDGVFADDVQGDE